MVSSWISDFLWIAVACTSLCDQVRNWNHANTISKQSFTDLCLGCVTCRSSYMEGEVVTTETKATILGSLVNCGRPF